MSGPFGTIEQAIDDLRAGRMIVVADDEDRENEGDLICAAELMTPEMVNFMTKRGSGLICLALPADRCDALGLAADDREQRRRLSHGVHGEHRRGGALRRDHRHQRADRATTIRVAADPATTCRATCATAATCIPLRARDGGVLQRVGHTEAAVDLARLAGLLPAGVICEILQ